MDAAKYLKEARRMCNTYGSCGDCPFKDSSCDCYREIENPEEMVFKVAKWASEHPIKTRQSEFLKMFPRALLTGNGILTIKPCVIDTEIKRSDKQCVVGCYGCKKAYWLAEVE